jgi:uncharacterized membrane protein YfcA
MEPQAAMTHLLSAINPMYVLSGFVIGALVGMTGVGGGSLMTPLLVLAFGVHPTTAVGTDLLYAATTKTVGTAVHGATRTIDWRIVGALAAGSVPATIITLLLLGHAEKQTSAVNHLITLVLGAALILTAISMLFRGLIVDFFKRRMSPASPRRTAVFTVILGAVLGTLVSLSSVGAGAIGMTVLLILYPEMPAGKLVGSDIAHAVPLTFIAGFGHWLLGSVDFHVLGSLLTGSIPGIILGSLAVSWVSDRVLRIVMALTLALVGGKLLT